jgi:hypothetical protein
MHRTKYKHGAERTAKAKESLEGSRASFDHIALSGLPFALSNSKPRCQDTLTLD